MASLYSSHGQRPAARPSRKPKAEKSPCARLPGSDNSYAYSIYLCAGILTWGLFAEIVARAQTMFIEQANLIKKISFPRVCLQGNGVWSSVAPDRLA